MLPKRELPPLFLTPTDRHGSNSRYVNPFGDCKPCAILDNFDFPLDRIPRPNTYDASFKTPDTELIERTIEDVNQLSFDEKIKSAIENLPERKVGEYSDIIDIKEIRLILRRCESKQKLLADIYLNHDERQAARNAELGNHRAGSYKNSEIDDPGLNEMVALISRRNSNMILSSPPLAQHTSQVARVDYAQKEDFISPTGGDSSIFRDFPLIGWFSRTRLSNSPKNDPFYVKENINNKIDKTLILDHNKKIKISDALIDLLNKSEFLFIGGTHETSDGKVIVDNLELLKEHGLTYVALEIPHSQQEGLNHYIATGNASNMNYPWDGIVKSIDCNPIIQKAKALGLKIIACDDVAVLDKRSYPGCRELNISDQLATLPQGGKKLVIIGAAHATLAEHPYRTARSWLNCVRSTSAISLQSYDGMMATALYSDISIEIAANVIAAYNFIAKNYSSWLNESFAYPTNCLSNLHFLNPFDLNFSVFLSYKQNYDYVFLLNENDTRLDLIG